MKTLINVPNVNLIGGVAQIYLVLQLDKIDGIDYFFIKDKNENSTIKKLPSVLAKYIQFICTIPKYNIVILNPSLFINSFIRDSIYCMISRLFRKKVIVFWHGWENSFENDLKKSWWQKRLFEVSFAKANIMLVLGPLFKNKLNNLGAKKSKYIYITSIADDSYLEEFDVIDKFNKQQHKQQLDLLFLSRIEEEKGIYIAIDVINKANKLHNDICYLHVAGDGSELEKVKEYVMKNNIKNIIFHGYVRGKEKFSLLESTDIFLLPTYYGEGQPNSILEAMLYAQPIISRINAAIPDVVTNDVNGYLSESIDYESFLPFVENFINNRNLIKEMGINNHNKALKSFTAEQVRKKYVEIINNV